MALTPLGSYETMPHQNKRSGTVKLENLTIVFENCEEVAVPASAIVCMHIGKVSENYYFDRGDLKVCKVVHKLSLGIDWSVSDTLVTSLDKSFLDRLMEYKDIAQLVAKCSDGSTQLFVCNFEQTSDGLENKNQVVRSSGNDLVCISVKE